MCRNLFSSLILREIIKEIGFIKEGVFSEIQRWAETMTMTYGQELEEHPVLYLTETEDYQARQYLITFKRNKIDVAENAINLQRGKHATEIMEFLKTRHGGWPVFAKHESVKEDHYTFPRDGRAAACFKEWFAVISVWRLTLAMPGITYQDATIGTAEILISSLPEPWEEKLEECLKVTEASAIVPAPKGWDLPLRRRDIDSILPSENLDTHESGLLTNGIISSWFQCLLARRERSRPDDTVFIPPDSLDLVGSTPQEVAEKKVMVNAKIKMVLFPTVIKEQDHCLLVIAYPQKKVVTVMDSQGSESTKRLQQDRPWLKEERHPKDGDWMVIWTECPHQGEEVAGGVFMLINALFLIMVKTPVGGYTHQDATFLRRYVAAVVCMGELPERV